MSSPPTSKHHLHSLKQIIPLTFFRGSAGCTMTEIYALSNRERWAAVGAWMLTLFVQISVVFLMLARPRLVPLVCPINSVRISSPAFMSHCFVLIPHVYLHWPFLDLLVLLLLFFVLLAFAVSPSHLHLAGRIIKWSTSIESAGRGAGVWGPERTVTFGNL